MIRSLAVAMVCLLSITVLGQTSTTGTSTTGTGTTTDTTTVVGHTPDENLSSAAARGPATWVAAARARHQAFIQARVTNPRQGLAAGTSDGLEPASDTATGASGGSVSLGGLGDLGSLIDSLGGTSGISSLVGGLTGGTSGSTTGTGTSTDTTGLADWIRQQIAAGGTTGDTTGKSETSNGKVAGRSMELRGGSGAIGRLPKIDDRSATSDTSVTGTGTTGTDTTGTSTDNRKFLERLASELADSFFSALTLGFQSDAFTSYIEAWMRPIFFPQDYTSSSDDSSNNSNDTNSKI